MGDRKKSAYEGMSYRELQGLAKGLKVPANLKKSEDDGLVESIVKTAMTEREETIRRRKNKSLQFQPNRGGAIRLAPKEPFVLLNNAQIYNTRQTRSKNKSTKHYPIVRCASLPLSRLQMADSTIKNPFPASHYASRTMSCARTNYLSETNAKKIANDGRNSTRKSATVLETLLQAPMSSKLDEIVADCTRNDDETIRTVMIMGDSEAKKQVNIIALNKLSKMSSDEPTTSSSRSDAIDLKVIGSEVHQIHWSRNLPKVFEDNDATSIETQLSQLNAPFGYQDFAAASSEHDHQYRIPDTSYHLENDAKLQIAPNPSQEPDLSETFAPERSVDVQENIKAGQQILDTAHQLPARRESFERMGFNVDYANDESNIYVEVRDYSSRQNAVGNTDDFYNDSGVQELDSYYGITKSDGDMSPRTYSAILNDYLNIPDMSGQTSDGYPGLSSNQNHDLSSGQCELTNENVYMETAVQHITQENGALRQELLQSANIQDAADPNEYSGAVVSVEDSGIGESEYDPLTTALTLNFQNYDSLGLSPLHDNHHEEADQEVACRVSELSRAFRRHSQWENQRAAAHVLCFLCNHVGRVAKLEEHLRKKHPQWIHLAVRGMMTLEVDVQTLSSGMFPLKQQAIIEHRDRLYVLRLKFKSPDSVCAIILAIPPAGQTVMEEPLPVVAYIQAVDPVTGDETTWRGCVECLNQPGRLTDADAFCHRASGRFEVMLRDIHVLPPVGHDEDVNLDGVVLPIHVLIQTLTDVVELEMSQSNLRAASTPYHI